MPLYFEAKEKLELQRENERLMKSSKYVVTLTTASLPPSRVYYFRHGDTQLDCVGVAEFVAAQEAQIEGWEYVKEFHRYHETTKDTCTCRNFLMYKKCAHVVAVQKFLFVD